MVATDPPAEGDTHTYERTFTDEDVRAFADVSGDRQAIHTEPDEDGRLVVHGLLTATLPTKIGGDLDVLASGMEFAFHRPVHTGEAVVCEWTNETVDERDDRYDLAVAVECTVDGAVVMTGRVEGLVWKDGES